MPNGHGLAATCAIALCVKKTANAIAENLCIVAISRPHFFYYQDQALRSSLSLLANGNINPALLFLPKPVVWLIPIAGAVPPSFSHFQPSAPTKPMSTK
jgi:hypothetical protein